VYSGVRNLEGEVLINDAGDASLNISWLAPVEEDMFHALPHYHLTLTPQSLLNSTQYFSIFPLEVQHTSDNYQIHTSLSILEFQFVIDTV
jgi:hypothetical protein